MSCECVTAKGDIPVWTQRVRISSYDVDSTRCATSASLCRYFLDAAWNHAEALGVGFTQLWSQGKLWVLARLRFEAEQYPAWGAPVTLRTWPRGIESVFAMREFEVEDEQGTRLAAGSSAWLVLDAASKRPQRLHKLLPALAELHGQHALSRDPEKLTFGHTGEIAFSTQVRYSDIDVNQHVNSIRYVSWILDAYPFGFQREHRLRVLEINFLGETLEGEELRLSTEQNQPGVYGHSVAKADGHEVCRARLEWEPKSVL